MPTVYRNDRLPIFGYLTVQLFGHDQCVLKAKLRLYFHPAKFNKVIT